LIFKFDANKSTLPGFEKRFRQMSKNAVQMVWNRRWNVSSVQCHSFTGYFWRFIDKSGALAFTNQFKISGNLFSIKRRSSKCYWIPRAFSK